MVDILVRNGLKEEILEGWKVTMEQKKIWNIELMLTREFLRVCKENDIQCVAGFGTLLGAVRHNGFIPWDDDMDFLLLRTDYEKLCKLSNRFKAPFFLQTTRTEHGKWFRGHARLRYSYSTCITPLDERNYDCNNGIFIDIFPLDELPDTENETDKFRRKVQMLKRIILHKTYKQYYMKQNWKHYLYTLFTQVFSFNQSVEQLSDKYDKLCSFYNQKNAKPSNLRLLSFNFVKGSRFDFSFDNSDIFPVVMHEFEGIEIPIPLNWNNNLILAYGNDYMKFPPVSERKAQEKNIVDPDMSYKEYMLMRK